MKNEHLEDRLRDLGREWPAEEAFVSDVMSRLESVPPRSPIAKSERKRIMRLSTLTVAAIVTLAGLWWAFGPQSTGSVLYADMKTALKQVQNFHATLNVRSDDGPMRPAIETWFARGQGFAVKSPEYIRIDNGVDAWDYRKGSDVAYRSKSQGTDELLDQALDMRSELEQSCERYPAGDRMIDGVDQACYLLSYRGTVKPADPAILNLDQRRTFIFIDPGSLPTLVETQEKVDGEWQTRHQQTWEYDTQVPPDVFKPDFGEHVRVVDADEVFEQLTSVEDAVHTEERDGLIFSIHQAKRFEGGGVLIMSSVRGTEETLRKYPLERRMLGPGRYATSCHAFNYDASPQFGNGFRLSIAEAKHTGVDVDWWIMVPRGRKPDWFEDEDGHVELKVGMTPLGEYAKENHADERGVIHHITWEISLEIPQPEELPSLSEIAKHVYADLKMSDAVSYKLLDLGVKEVNGVSSRQHGTIDDVTPEQFATATVDQVHWWEQRDVDFQLQKGGRGEVNDEGEWVSTTPGAFLDHYSLVDDATLARVPKERQEIVELSLRATHITDAGLAQLSKLEALKELNIAETSITDEGLRHLEDISTLQKIDVTDTQVTPMGIERLQQALPGLEIVTGE